MISSTLVFLIASAYATSPMIEGGIPMGSEAARTAWAVGSLMAGIAAFSSFPAGAPVRLLNSILGVALILSPITRPDWPITALVIQFVVGCWVTGLSLLPRTRDRVVTGGGWKGVFTSPSRIDRIETAMDL